MTFTAGAGTVRGTAVVARPARFDEKAVLVGVPRAGVRPGVLAIDFVAGRACLEPVGWLWPDPAPSAAGGTVVGRAGTWQSEM